MSAYFCLFLLIDSMHFALVFSLLRPDIKPYCRPVKNTTLFFRFSPIFSKNIYGLFLSDLMRFVLILLLFRFVSVENKKTSRPDVKAYCQTFDTRVFFVGIPNFLDINLNFFGCIFCTFYCEPAKNTTIIFRFSLTFSNNNYEPLGLLTTGFMFKFT